MFPTLYLNENINIALINELSRFGIKAIHTIRVGNRSISDESQLKYATKNNYIVLTHNRWDFRKLHEEWLKKNKYHPGIIGIGPGETQYLVKRIKKFLEEIYPSLTPPFYAVPPQI